MTTNSDLDEREQLKRGGQVALADLLSRHLSSLERIIRFRLEPSLRSRLDPADILQEAFIEISQRIDEYIAGVSVSFFVWIRQKTVQKMIDIQRGHLSDKRSVHREVSQAPAGQGQTSCISIARLLLDDRTSPSQAAVKAEEIEQLQSALESMNETDREVLAMRHFEQLSNLQVSEVLGISITAASNRYIRAAAKLSEIMQHLQTKHDSL